MCRIWCHQTAAASEITPKALEKLPKMFFTNVGGGETFLRDDLDDVVRVLRPKTKRMVLSTNGQMTRRIVRFAESFPDVGIRISIDGLAETHDQIRGVQGSFRNAYRTLLSLGEMGHEDSGIAMTLQDANFADLIPLYRLAKSLRVEFATGLVQNASYFRATDNKVIYGNEIASVLETLSGHQLSSWRPKDWFRAYFNAGLARRARNQLHSRKCEMGGSAGFVTDPEGNVLPCNSHDKRLILGNLRHQSWDEIWNGPQAAKVRRAVASCEKRCWAIGDVAPEIWRSPGRPAIWVGRALLRNLIGMSR
jgi:MoaA/NifB/PqqE/SkfB family radical SAM enzyme